MPKYAEKTEVPSAQSRNEIERILTKYGASKFMYVWQEDNAMIAFEASGLRVKFVLPLPDRNSRDFLYTPERGIIRSKEAQDNAYEQSVRQRWRALALVIKAKLEAVEAGISCFESEFLGKIVLPGGGTVEEYMLPQIEQAYRTGIMPPMLPMLGDGGYR
jgi:hypothetical protein